MIPSLAAQPRIREVKHVAQINEYIAYLSPRSQTSR